MPVIVVCGADRAWRLACAEALRGGHCTVRLASSAAELAKALRESPEALVVAEETVRVMVTQTVTPGRLIWREGGESGAVTGARVLALGDAQPTSSA